MSMLAAPRRSVVSMVDELVNSPILGLAVAALIWSGNFVVGRALRHSITPLALNFWRWTIALAVLLPLTYGLLVQHRQLLVRHWKLIAGLGLTGIACFHTCVYLALATTTAANTALLLSVAPVLIVLVSWAMLGERISLPQVIGIGVSFIGAMALIVHGSVDSLAELGAGSGELWMLLGVLFWVAYSLLLKRVPKELPQPALLTVTAMAAVLFMLPFYLWLSADEGLLSLDRKTVWGILYMALFPSAVAFLLWNRGVARIGPSRAGTFIYLIPVFGAILAFAFLGEGLELYQLGSAAVIFLGIAAMNWKRAMA